MRVHAYLTFNGNCAEAFAFYAEKLGGTIKMITPFGGTPAAEHVPADWAHKTLHASMAIGDAVIMGSDAGGMQYEKPQGFSVALVFDDAAEGERVFNILAEGGAITMPFAPTFWSTGFGMLVDKFGTPWIINCDPAAQP
jgi:PhnB protein